MKLRENSEFVFLDRSNDFITDKLIPKFPKKKPCNLTLQLIHYIQFYQQYDVCIINFVWPSEKEKGRSKRWREK